MMQFNFIMIYIIYKVSVFLKITIILKHSLRSIINIYSFKIPKLHFFWESHESVRRKSMKANHFRRKQLL